MGMTTPNLPVLAKMRLLNPFKQWRSRDEGKVVQQRQRMDSNDDEFTCYRYSGDLACVRLSESDGHERVVAASSDDGSKVTYG